MKIKSFGISLALASTFSLGLSGCASTGEKFEVENIKRDKAILYIYRPSGFGGSLISYSWYNFTDNKKIGLLKNGGYLKYEMKKGKNRIVAFDDANVGAKFLAGGLIGALAAEDTAEDIVADYNLTVQANKTYCIRHDLSTWHPETNGIVDLKTCLKEIKDLKYSY